MINAEILRDAHRDCGCVVQDRLAASDHGARPISHHGCRLNIRGLRVAIDCDKCQAYGPNDEHPDLLVLRERDGACEWIVIEIQRTMDRAARSQVEAGLQTLAEDPLLADASSCRPYALFAHKRGVRAQEQERLRKPLRSRGQVVDISVKRCGTVI